MLNTRRESSVDLPGSFTHACAVVLRRDKYNLSLCSVRNGVAAKQKETKARARLGYCTVADRAPKNANLFTEIPLYCQQLSIPHCSSELFFFVDVVVLVTLFIKMILVFNNLQ